MLLLLTTALASARTACSPHSLDGAVLAAVPVGSEIRYACEHSSSAPGGPASRTVEWLEDGLVLVSETGVEVELDPVRRFLRKPWYRIPELEAGRWTVWWRRIDPSGNPFRATDDSATFWVGDPPH